jgi:hypothetical protein
MARKATTPKGELKPMPLLTDAQKAYAEQRARLWGRAGIKAKKTPALIDAILRKVSLGYPLDVSCATNEVMRVSYDAFNEWCKADATLRHRLDGALLTAENMCLDPILQGAQQGNKFDSQWMLTHRWPHKYKTQVDLPPPNPNAPVDATAELIAFITKGTRAHPRKNARGSR